VHGVEDRAQIAQRSRHDWLDVTEVVWEISWSGVRLASIVI
jgi:hypothetical protein